MKKSILFIFLVIIVFFISSCTSSKEPSGKVKIESNYQPKTITTFLSTGEEVCRQDGKPIVRLFATSTCPHCKWIKKTFINTVSDYIKQDKIIAYLWEVDTNDNLLTKEKDEVPESEIKLFNKYSPNKVPAFIFGCRYYRIGNGYEPQNNLNAEEAEFRLVIGDLLGGGKWN